MALQPFTQSFDYGYRVGGRPNVTGGATAGVTVDPGAGFLIYDDFTGSSIDTSKWNVIDRDGDSSVGEESAMRAANVTVASSIATFTAKQETFTTHLYDISAPHNPTTTVDRDYSAGMIQQKTTPFLYGTIDVRYKIPGGDGFWPLPIWMLGHLWQPSQPYDPNDPANTWPTGGWWEIDVAEYFTGTTDAYNCMIQTGHGGFQNLGLDVADRWVRSRLIWTSGSVIWRFDPEDGAGNPVGWTTLLTNTTDVPQVAGYLVISMPVGGNGGGGGPPFGGPFPSSMQVDWVRVTQP